jgi:hypothetical protein
VAISVLLLGASPARATTFIPMSVEDLTRSSEVIVAGRVESVGGDVGTDGAIQTLVRIDVASVLKGDPGLSHLTLREPGGSVGTLREVVYGAPVYGAGEHVVVFARPGPAEAFTTNQLALGKFRITADRSGELRAAQQFGSGVTVIVPPDGASWRPELPLAELLDRIARTTGVIAPPPFQELEGAGDRPAETSAPFMLFPEPGRFFEPDEGEPLRFLIDERGDAILGLTASRRAVDDALAVWTGVGSARIELLDDGLSSAPGRECEPGEHRVLFDDPFDEIPPPVRCTGTLGVGGFCSTAGESKSFNDTDFERALRARLTLADGWEGCADWTECNVAEIAAHEIGHAIGIWHSSEDPLESDPVLEDATMYFLAHFDGRCAALRSDDVAAVTFLYPNEAPPTITTASPLADGVAGQAYNQPLAATGGKPPYTWTEGPGGCMGFPGLEVGAGGVIQGTPQAFGEGCFEVVLTDTNGDRHVKRFDISVSQVGSSPTPSSSPTSPPSPTPSPSPTSPLPTATRSEGSCTGDCNGNGMVAINEVILGVNIALDLASFDLCPVFDQNQNGTIAINELILGVGFGLNGCP